MLLPVFLFVTTFATANGASHDAACFHRDDVHRLIEITGIASHITTVQETLRSEIIAARSACQSAGTPELELLLRRTRPDILVSNVVDNVSNSLSREAVTQVEMWYRSEGGRLIVDAESATQEDAGEARANKSSNQSRQYQLLEMLKATRTGEFLFVMDSEITQLVELLSICKPAPTDVRHWQDRTKHIRGERQFAGQVILIQLMPDANRIYQDVPDPVLQAYLEFAASEAGKSWFSAIVDSVASEFADVGIAMSDSLSAQ